MCGCLSHCPYWRAWPATQACVLTGNWTSDPLVHRLALSPLIHTSQGIVTRTFEISLSNFQIYNTILLIIVTMLDIISPWLTYFVTGSLCLWITFTYFAHSLSPTSDNHQSVLFINEFGFLFLFLKIPHISKIRWNYLWLYS